MRTLHLTNPPMHGPDVRELQTKLGVAVDGVYGPHTAEKVVQAKWRLGYPSPDCLPVAGERFRRLLAEPGAAPEIWRQRAARRGGLEHREAQQRHRILDAAAWGVKNEARIHYGQVRPFPLAYELPLTTDCSGFATLCYFLAKLPDPNGNHYSGLGYTGTLSEHGKPITRAQAQPGDLVFFGPWPHHHVVVFIQGLPNGDALVVSHGQEDGPRELLLSIEAAAQPNPVSFRSYL